MSDVIKCTDCKFAVLEDYGYSNYTVENTTFSCAKDLHPEHKEFDTWYKEEKKLFYAKDCKSFTAGNPVELDVDRENELTAEEKEILKMRDAWIEKLRADK